MIIIKSKENRDYADRFTPLLYGVIGIPAFFIIAALFIRNTVDCDGDMFSFAGAIIGGGMTLIGVIFTIMYQEVKLDEARAENEAKRKEDLFYQYRPMFKCFDPTFTLVSKNNNYNIEFYLKNIGRGEATDINIEITNLDYLDHSLENDGRLLYSSTKLQILPSDDTEKICISITPSLFAKYKSYTFLIQIKYNTPFLQDQETSVKLNVEMLETPFEASYIVRWVCQFNDYRIK